MKKENFIYILQGMPTLLGQFPFPQFQPYWPQTRELPPLGNRAVDEEKEEFNLGKQFCVIQKVEDTFQLRGSKKISNCEHTDRKHYARGMCTSCYYQSNKKEKVAKCGHTDRMVFARNMCCSCYSAAYKAYKKDGEKSKK